MTACVYCGLEAANVIEVRYARTIGATAVGARSEDENAPREILARGYYLCDGCLALVDFHVEHHLSARKQSTFNALAAVYFFAGVWMLPFTASLAGEMALVRNRAFLALGVALAFISLAVWFLRAKVFSDYFAAWQEAREKPIQPAATITAMTDLRDRRNPELAGYLPVRYDDSVRLAKLPGSPPVRSLGPNGEAWGEGPQPNFPGNGANGYYRLVWISWRLWPLTNVVAPTGVAWTPPPPPALSLLEVGGAATLGGGAFAALLGSTVPLWGAVVAVMLCAPIGFLVGRLGRRFVEAHERERAVR